MADTKETTTVIKQEVSAAELSELLDIPGADSAMLPDEKPSFYSRNLEDITFIDKKPKKIEAKTEETTEAVKDEDKTTVDEIIQQVNPDPDKQEETSTKGRPKVDKDAAIELTKKLIEKKILTPFDDDKPVDEYTVGDLEELFEANFKDKEERLRQEVPVEFFDSLPEELQYAAKYVADGGKDMKGLFKALSEVQAVHELSADEPKDHESIVTEYLTVTNFGTPEDIEEEVNSWKDLNKLEEKAQKFKPKLDKLREEQVTQRLARQEAVSRQQQEASRNYTNSVYETLKPSELNGLKLDKKTQGMLYSGLVQPQYPSLSGKPTNLLGHLLEKYQFVEPNHSLIAEALWLLADPEGYKSKVKEGAKNAQVEETVRKLKTEETRKLASTSVSEKDDSPRQRKIPRQENFFKR